MRSLVVIPTYNEVDNIAEALARVREAAADVDILVVDDSSPDGTAALVEELQRADPRVHLLVRPGKSGLGAAYRAGFAWGRTAGFDLLCEMDADLSHDPSEIPALIGAIEEGADLAIGSRYVPGGSIPDWAWYRKALSRYGNKYAGALLGLGVSDATAGYRAYRGEVLDAIELSSVRADGYGFQVEMTYRAAQMGKHIVEIPIVFRERRRGKSKMSMRIVAEAMWLVTRWGVADRLRRS